MFSVVIREDRWTLTERTGGEVSMLRAGDLRVECVCRLDVIQRILNNVFVSSVEFIECTLKNVSFLSMQRTHFPSITFPIK
jgi:hypothetical protein